MVSVAQLLKTPSTILRIIMTRNENSLSRSLGQLLDTREFAYLKNK